MVQVHTVYQGFAWRTLVDGLRQGCAGTTRNEVLHEGRQVAEELGACHYVHDVDGRVVEVVSFRDRGIRPLTGSSYYVG